MYELSQIIKGLRDPQRAAWEIGWIYHRKIRDKKGTYVLSEDWDCLVVLDACRYDLFEQENSLPGTLHSKVSTGSNTGEFLRSNFGNKSLDDVVYVSANPQVQNHRVQDNFHDCIRLWETEWDSELRTVPPESVTEAAIKARNDYPNKKLIVHFLQPHYPFIGESGRKIDHGTLDGGGIIAEKRDKKTIWNRMKDGEISEERVWEAYRENLNIVFPSLESLINKMNEKIVITSDHGNSFGRWGIYGHPPKHYLADLVEVPWLVIEGENRIEAIEEESSNRDGDTNDIEDQLADLGYL